MEKLTRVHFSNLDKVLYPAVTVRKAQVVRYYLSVAPRMLGFLNERVVVSNRFPDGVQEQGFYEKDAPNGKPDWVETFTRFSQSSRRYIRYVLCNNLDTLLWLANLSALEIHVTLSLVDAFEKPDLALFDLDPKPPAGFGEAIEVALLLKEKLDAMGLVSFVKTTGKKGLHVVLPIVREYTYAQTREFVHQVGKLMAKESHLVVSEASQSRDPGKVFIDYPQNSSSRTMICPYSLRAEPEATVSTPLDWSQLYEAGLTPSQHNIFTLTENNRNPWKDILESRQRLSRNG